MNDSGERVSSAERADLLITNATVITVDGRDSVVSDGAVAVVGSRIADVGPSRDLCDRWSAARVIDAHGAIVLPGFVNTHAHLAMTLFRGWADDVDLQAFLDRMLPVEGRIVSPETVRVGVELAIAESFRAGITTALDMYFHPGVAAEVARAAGFRIANGPVVFSFPGPDATPYEERMEQADALLGSCTGELTAGRWLCPHGTYTIELDHLGDVRDLAARHRARLTIHAAENAAEVDTVLQLTGRRPVELLADLGLLSSSMVLAHAVELTDHEIELLAQTGASVAHNPLSNLKLASGVARVPDLINTGVRVGLGTDGTASSNDLDLYGAMRFAATLHKGHRRDATVVPAVRVLRMATIDGAAMLGMETEFGSLEVGKRADLQVLWADHPNLVPAYDPISTVVYAAGRGDVRTVVVDGRIVLDDGVLTTLDLASTVRSAREIAAVVRATA